MQINSDLAVEFAADLLQSSNTKCKNTDAVQRVEITEKSLFSDRCGVYYDINCEQAGEDTTRIEYYLWGLEMQNISRMHLAKWC